MDDDFDLNEPHTPATLDSHNAQGSGGDAGLFPHQTGGGPSGLDTSGGKGGGAAASPQQRFAHNPYGKSPRHSPSIPVGEKIPTPPHLSPHRTPVGSLDGRGGLQVGSRGGGGMATLGLATSPNTRPQPGAGAALSAVPAGGFKAEMCRYILSGTPCPRGAACAFAHYPEELRGSGGIGGGPGVPVGGNPSPGGAPSSAPRGSHPGGAAGIKPRLSGASVDDGGRMGIAMSEPPPRPSWMGASAAQPSSGSAPIPVSPIAEAMMRPQSGSLPRGSMGQPASLGSSAPRMGGAAAGQPGSAPRFAGRGR